MFVPDPLRGLGYALLHSFFLNLLNTIKSTGCVISRLLNRYFQTKTSDGRMAPTRCVTAMTRRSLSNCSFWTLVIPESHYLEQIYTWHPSSLRVCTVHRAHERRATDTLQAPRVPYPGASSPKCESGAVCCDENDSAHQLPATMKHTSLSLSVALRFQGAVSLHFCAFHFTPSQRFCSASSFLDRPMYSV